MKIGYACLTVGVPNTQMRTTRKANATPDKLKMLIQNNLDATESILDYNNKHGIQMYRLSSDLIPFGSDAETNSLDWEALFAPSFERLAEKIKRYGMRVSMHPGQYTVLNSPKSDVVERAIADLEYHVKVMAALKVDASHKIILHIGGIYGDKEAAKERFIEHYQSLNAEIKSRLVIENDDRLFTIEDVLKISHATGAPVVYDNLHNACNPSNPEKSDVYWIHLAKDTWQDVDGRAKVHYSQQRLNGRMGAHTSTIYIDPFMTYYQAIAPLEVDIMLEVKDKNLSAVKCHLATTEKPKMKNLEVEWSRYKYLILLHSPSHYQVIRELLKDKSSYPVITFYRLIEEALDISASKNVKLNAVEHVWGHLSNEATDTEKDRFDKMKHQWLNSEITSNRLKNWLRRLAVKYDETYLLQSLFFELD